MGKDVFLTWLSFDKENIRERERENQFHRLWWQVGKSKAKGESFACICRFMKITQLIPTQEKHHGNVFTGCSCNVNFFELKFFEEKKSKEKFLSLDFWGSTAVGWSFQDVLKHSLKKKKKLGFVLCSGPPLFRWVFGVWWMRVFNLLLRQKKKKNTIIWTFNVCIMHLQLGVIIILSPFTNIK